MSSDTKIVIDFEVHTEKLREAVELLKQLVQPLQQYQTTAVGVASATQTMGTAMARGVDFTSLWRQSLENVAIALGASEEKAARAGEILEKLTTTTVSPRVETRYLNELAEITGKTARTMRMEVAMLRDQFEELSRVDVTGNLPTQFTRIGAIIPHLSSLAEALGREYGLVDDQLQQFTASLTNLARLKLPEDEFRRAAETLSWAFLVPREAIEETVQEMREHAATYIDEVNKMQRASRGAAEGMEPIVEILRQQTRENMIFQATIAPFINTMRQMTSQFYWWGVGIMFVTMSYARLQQRILTHEQRVLSLARAYASVIEAQNDFNKATIEYGAASEEARRAYGRLIEAKEAYKLAIESTRIALVQENLAWAQMIFGTFPVVINAFRLGFDLGLLLWRGEILAAAGGAVLAATQSGQVAPAMWDVTVSAFGSTVAIQQYGGALTRTAMLSILAKPLLLGVGFALFSIALSWILLEYAQRKAEEEMKKMMAEIKKLGSQLAGATGDVYSLENAIAGHSLVDALREAREAVGDLNREFGELQYPEIIEQEYIVHRRVEEVELPPIRDQFQYIVQKLVPVEIEKPEDLVQTIYQRVAVARLPSIPETVFQNIIQRVYSARIEEPRDLFQNIYQRVIESRIEEPRPVYQDVIQRLIGEIPSIEPQTLIVRRVVVGEVPRIGEQVLTIRRVVSGEIPQIREQILNVRRIVTGDIPEIGDAYQRVRRTVTVDVPSILEGYQYVSRVLAEDIAGTMFGVQYITRELVEDIPPVKDEVQTIRRIVEGEIPRTPETVYQNIVQRVLEARIPEVEDQVQTIRREVVGEFPEVPREMITLLRIETVSPRIPVIRLNPIAQTIYYNIEGEIPPVPPVRQEVRRELIRDIPAISDQTQYIRRTLLEDVEPVEDQIQRISRVLASDIPEVEDTIQNVSRILVSDIPALEETVQPVRRVLTEDVPRIEEVVQPVNRVLVNEIPEVAPIAAPVIGGGEKYVYINVSFPNLIIREEADIALIEDTVFRAIHSGLRGEVVVR